MFFKHGKFQNTGHSEGGRLPIWVCLVSAGVDKAGKTTLLERLKTMYGPVPGTDPERILPTVGLNVGRMQVGELGCRMHINSVDPKTMYGPVPGTDPGAHPSDSGARRGQDAGKK